jgi:hypothetical protein
VTSHVAAFASWDDGISTAPLEETGILFIGTSAWADGIADGISEPTCTATVAWAVRAGTAVGKTSAAIAKMESANRRLTFITYSSPFVPDRARGSESTRRASSFRPLSGTRQQRREASRAEQQPGANYPLCGGGCNAVQGAPPPPTLLWEIYVAVENLRCCGRSLGSTSGRRIVLRACIRGQGFGSCGYLRASLETRS